MDDGTTIPAPQERLKADLLLVGVAVIWGSAFVAQRVAAGEIGTFLFNGLRFTLGALVLLPLLGPRLKAITRRELRGGALAGSLLFGAAALQQAGLQFTTAGKAGFITGLYVVIIPLLLALVWRQRPGRLAWMASLLAAAGLFLLSVTEEMTLASGDGLELVGAVLWALHVIVIGFLAKQVETLRLALIQYVVCGALSLAVGFSLEAGTLSNLPGVWWTVAYTGVFSISIGYTLQVYAQRTAPPTDTAVILSGEAVFAALGGWIFLGELLTPRQLFGCGLMLAAMLLAQIRPLASRGRLRRRV